MPLTHIRIVGSGLIGSSIALSLRAKGVGVTMVDIDPAAAALAQDLVGEAPSTPPDLVLIASPVSTVAQVIKGEIQQSLNLGFMDISSVKVNPVLEVSALGLDMSRFLPTHPMAGREVGGAESARADLFQQRPWIIDSTGVGSQLLAAGIEIIEICGGHLIDMASAEHDKAVALISHLPQILSSALAAQLEAAPATWLELAGAGLRDTTRIASSSPALWREIITSNSAALTPLLGALIADLQGLADQIADPESVENFMKAGNRGRAMIPGKHGGAARNYTYLPVVIEDKPGQLAALFDECAEAQVNIEDLSIEHSPEQFTGLITLALSSSDAEKLYSHLQSRGWRAHSPRTVAL